MKHLEKLKWKLGVFGLLIPIPILIPLNYLSGFGNVITILHGVFGMIAFMCTGLSRTIYWAFGLSLSSSMIEKLSFMVLNGLIYFIFGYIVANVLEEGDKRSHVMASLFLLLFLFLNAYFLSFIMIFLSA